MSTLPNRKHDAREALLDAAEKLFLVRGYTSVSTRDLAEEANVNLAAIQYHFGSKGKLFVEAVRRLMSRKEHTSPFGILEGPHESADAAAVAFARFVQIFITELANPTGPDVCRIIFREAFSEDAPDPEMREEIISSMVEGLHRPSFERLVSALRCIAPEVGGRDVELHAQSVIAQCTFYRTHQPFLACLGSCTLGTADEERLIATHIARMTLVSLGWSAGDVVSVLARAVVQPMRPIPCEGSGKQTLEEEEV